jgi:alkanesulfonate monooxygenase SsuD/methylene tetrahydromethanopterin reductase-like flavin-dependent oxidoreductase (luciferase family)
MPEQQIKEYLIYGTVETVQTQVEKLEEVGVQYFIVHLDPSDQYNQLETFSESIIKKMK